ncbi:MAG: ABC transporter permease [Anaerofustis stercorihominis]|nr:ABC transporter permease [Anaerofustis stercorihominis]
MIKLVTIQSGIAQGLLWAVLTIGVYITYRVLDFADLTIEGTFPLGAAVTVVLINAGVNPFLATLIAMAAGVVAGLSTGILNTVLKIPAILSGILTMIALYSVNIRIMSDKATVAIAGNSIKKIVAALFPAGTVSNTLSTVTGVIVCALLIIFLYIFFGTEIGCAIRATGNNPKMSRSVGINTDLMTIIGLMLSNAIVALSGSLIAQFDYGSALVNMGQGTIVIGLASVIIGEVILIHKEHNFAYRLFSVVFGAILYRTIIACVLTISGFKATDIKIITAIIVAIALSVPVFKEKAALTKKRKSAK